MLKHGPDLGQNLTQLLLPLFTKALVTGTQFGDAEVPLFTNNFVALVQLGEDEVPLFTKNPI
jgi:hypothetical protein